MEASHSFLWNCLMHAHSPRRAAGRVQLLTSCYSISFRSGQRRWPGPVLVLSLQVLSTVGISLHARRPSTLKMHPIIFPGRAPVWHRGHCAGVPGDRCLSSVPTGHSTVRRARVQIPPGTLSWVTLYMQQNYMHPAFSPSRIAWGISDMHAPSSSPTPCTCDAGLD